MLRARLMASASIRWCAVQTPEIRRGRILPRSGMKFCRSFTSLKSMRSTLSTQNRQTLRRRMRPRAPPRPRCSRPAGIPSSSASKSRSPLSMFLDIILFSFSQLRARRRASRERRLGARPLSTYKRKHAGALLRLVPLTLPRGDDGRAPASARGCRRERTLGGLARASRLELLCTSALLVNAHREVAYDLIAHAHAALKLCDLAPRPLDLEEHVDALVLASDLVGELAAAHDFRLGYGAALVGDDCLKVFRQAFCFFIRRVGVYDEDDLVNSFLCQNHPPLGCLASTMTVEARKKVFSFQFPVFSLRICWKLKTENC